MRLFRAWDSFWGALGLVRRNRRQRKAAFAKRRNLRRRHRMDALEQRVVLNADAVDDTLDTSYESSVVIAASQLTNNDSYSGNPTVTVTLPQTTAQGGSLVDNNDGTFTYTPAAGFSGGDSFQYTLSDEEPSSDSATVTINVGSPPNNDPPPNNAPWAGDNYYTYEVPYGAGWNSYEVSGYQPNNFGDPDGETPSIVSNGNPGWVNAGPGAGVSYGYTVQDSAGAQASGTVYINFVEAAPPEDPPEDPPENLAPYAYDVTYSVVIPYGAGSYGFDLSSHVPNYPNHYGDPDGGAPSISYSNFGWTQLSPGQQLSYSYSVTDGMSSASATVFINVVEDFAPPSVPGGNFTIDEDAALTLQLSNPSGAPLTLYLTAASAHGSVSIAGGAVVFTPAVNYFGSDSFSYYVTDGSRTSNTETVSVEILSVNDPPLALTNSFTLNEDGSVTIAVAELIADDQDVEGQMLAFAGFEQPGAGTLVDNFNGTLTYYPPADFNGSDSFSYHVSDGMNVSTGSVTLNITPMNDAPYAGSTSLEIGVGHDQYEVGIPGGLYGDVDGDDLTLAFNPLWLSPGAGGTLYYTVTDPSGAQASGSVSVSTYVLPNNEPFAQNDGFSTSEDTPAVLEVRSNDWDADYDVLAPSIIEGPAHGAVVVNVDGTLTYTPAHNYEGADSFTYQVADGWGGLSTATVTISVSPVEDAPEVVEPVVLGAVEDTVAEFATSDLLVGLIDPEGLSLVVTGVGAASRGQLVDNGDGTLTYTPEPDFYGDDSFEFTVSDGGLTTTVTAVIRVAPANDAPAVSAPTAVQFTGSGATLIFSAAGDNALTVGDVEPGVKRLTLLVDHGQLSYGSGSPATQLVINGTVAQLNAALEGLRFHAPTAYAGPAQLSLAIDDQDAGGALTAAATVDLRIRPTLSVADASANESEGTMTFVVTLSAAYDQNVTVAWQTQAGTADANDFTPASGTLTIAAGETTGTIVVAPTNDNRDEDDQTFQLLLADPVNAALADAEAIGTIQDDEAAPSVYVVSREARERDGTVQVVVRLSHPSEKDVYVEWHPLDGTALRGADGNSYDWTQGMWNPPYSQPESQDLGWYVDNWIDTSGYQSVYVPDQYGDVWVDTSHYGDVWVTSGHWGDPIWVDTSHYGDVWIDTSYWGDVWVPNMVNEPIWINDQLDEYGNVVTPGYWQDNWVDRGSNQWQLIPDGHYENQWITEGHYENQWIDTSHYENQWITEGHFENVLVTPAHWDSQWVTSGYNSPQWVPNWQSVDVWYPGYWTDGGVLHFAIGEVERAAEVTILDDGETEGDESFSINLSNPSNAVLTGESNGTVTIRSSDNSPTAAGYELSDPLAVGQSWSSTTTQLLAALQAADPDGEALSVTLPFGALTYGTLVDAGNGTFTYQATSVGTELINVTVTDAEGLTNTVTLTINVVADSAPVLDPQAVAPLNPIAEDVAVADNVGTLVADLIAGAVTDANDTEFGIAIIAAAALGGHWQYKLTAESAWITFPATLADENALRLYADSATRVRYVPAADYYYLDGEPAPALVFRAWDRSDEEVETSLNGTTADVSTTGGTAPYSTATATTTIDVTPVNDAPTFVPGENVTVEQDGGDYLQPWATALSAGPQEAGQELSWTVEVDNPQLFEQGPVIDAEGRLQFRPAAGMFGTAMIVAVLKDDGGAASNGIDASAPIAFQITVEERPTITVEHAVQAENNGPLVFTVTLSQPFGEAVAFDWTLVGGTATLADNDETDFGYVRVPAVPPHEVAGYDVYLHSPQQLLVYFNLEYSDDFGNVVPAGAWRNAGGALSEWINGAYTTGETEISFNASLLTHIDGDPDYTLFPPNNNDGQPYHTFVANSRIDAGSDARWEPAHAHFGRLEFGPWETSKTIEVYLYDDPRAEADETFQLVLSNAYRARLSASVAVGTILNDDANHVPTAVGEQYEVDEDGSLSVAANNGVAANDSDLDGDAFSYSLVGGPVAGLTFNADGSFVYAPPSDFYGSTTFVYEVADTRGGTSQATATITVAAVPDAPVVHVPSFPYQVVEQTSLLLHGTGLAIVDADGMTGQVQLTLSVDAGRVEAAVGATGVSASGSGTASLVLSGTLAQVNAFLAGVDGGALTYEYDDDAAPLSDKLSLSVVDFGGPTPLTATAEQFIEVAQDTTLPTFSPLTNLTIAEDEASVVVEFTVGDDLTPADQLVVTATSSDTSLIPTENIVIAGSGAERTLTIMPAADRHGGPVTVGIAVSDGERSRYRTFTVLVEPVNDAPTFTLGGEIGVPVDAGRVEIDNVLTNLSVGPADEASQTYTVTVTADVPELFAADGLPAIVVDENGVGKLTFTPKFAGTAVLTVVVKDSGGTADGGRDETSKTLSLTIGVPGDESFGGGTSGISSGGSIQPTFDRTDDLWAIAGIAVVINNDNQHPYFLVDGRLPHVPVDGVVKVEVGLAPSVPPGAKVELTWGADRYSGEDAITETRAASPSVTFTKDFSDPNDERLPSEKVTVRVEAADGRLLEERIINFILDWPTATVEVDNDRSINTEDAVQETIEIDFDVPEKLRRGVPTVRLKDPDGPGSWPFYPNAGGESDPNFNRSTGVYTLRTFPTTPGTYTYIAQYGHAYTEFDVTVTGEEDEGDAEVVISMETECDEGTYATFSFEIVEGEVDPETEFTVTIDWGDEEKTYKVKDGDQFAFSHLYRNGSINYPVSMTVRGGGADETQTGTMLVKNVAPEFQYKGDLNHGPIVDVRVIHASTEHSYDFEYWDIDGNYITGTNYEINIVYEGYIFDPGYDESFHAADGDPTLIFDFEKVGVEGQEHSGFYKFTASYTHIQQEPVFSVDDLELGDFPGFELLDDGYDSDVAFRFHRADIEDPTAEDEEEDETRRVAVSAEILDSVAGEPIELADGTPVVEAAVVRFSRSVLVAGNEQPDSNYVTVDGVRRDGDADERGTTTITYHFEPVAGSNGATPGDWPSSGTAVIGSGKKFVDVLLTPTDDGLAEWNERFQLVIDTWTHRGPDDTTPVVVGEITVLDDDVQARFGSNNVDTAATGLTREWVETLDGGLVSLYNGSRMWVVPFGDGELGALYEGGTTSVVNTMVLPSTTGGGAGQNIAVVSDDRAVFHLNNELTLRRNYGGVADLAASFDVNDYLNVNPTIDGARFGFIDRLIPVETGGFAQTTPLLGFLLMRRDGTTAWYAAKPTGSAAETVAGKTETTGVRWTLTGLQSEQFYQVTLPYHDGELRYDALRDDIRLEKGTWVTSGQMSGQTTYGASIGFIIPDADGKIEIFYKGSADIGASKISAFDRWDFVTPEGSRAPDSNESLATLVSAGDGATDGQPRLVLTTKFGDRSEFDGRGLLTAETDRLGNRSEYSYEPARRDFVGLDVRLTQIKRQGGLVLDFEYAAEEGKKLSSIAEYVGSAATNNPTRRVTLVNGDMLISTTPGDAARSLAIHARSSNPTSPHGEQDDHLKEIQITSWIVAVGGKSFTGYAAAPTGNISSTSTSQPAASYRRAYYDLASVEAAPKEWTYQFDRFGLITAKAAPKGPSDPQRQVWTWEREARSGFVKKLSAPPGQGDTVGADLDPPEGGRFDTSFEYDDRGNLESVTYADGTSESFAYALSKNSRLESHLDRFGNTTTYDLYDDGSIAAVHDPLGNVTSFAYLGGTAAVTGRPNGLVELVTDPNNVRTKYEYFGQNDGRKNGLVKKITHAFGSSDARFETFDYDVMGHLQTHVDVDGVTHRYQYDKLGQLLEQRVGGSVNASTGELYDGLLVAKFVYDASGNLRTSSRPGRNGELINTVYEYDYYNRLLKTTETGASGSGKVVNQYLYYGDGLLRQATDPADRVTEYEYDDRRQLSLLRQSLDGVADAGSGVQDVAHYFYDVAGNLQVEVLQGRTTTYTYDATGRLLRKRLPDPDGGGGANSANLPELFVHYGYDEHGNVAESLPRPDQAVNNSLPVARTFYDAAGRLLREEGPAVTVGEGQSAELQASFTAYEYWPDGSVKYVREGFAQSPSGSPPEADGRRNDDLVRLTTYTEFDALGRLKKQAISGVGVPLAETTFAYYRNSDNPSRPVADAAAVRYEVVTEPPTTDASGNPVPRVTWNYYDQYDRLIRTVRPDPDGAGNLKAVSDVYSYNVDGTVAKSWQEVGADTTHVREINYAYDALSRLIRKDDQLGLVAGYKYDVLGRIEVEYLSGGMQIAYEYDALDRVISKQYVDVAGLQAETFAYNYHGNLRSHTNEYGDTTTYD